MAALGNATYPAAANDGMPPTGGPLTSVPWLPIALGNAVSPPGEDGSGIPGVQVATIPAQGQMWPRGGVAPTSPGHAIQEEGTALTSRPALNFVGSGVTATDDAANARTIVTVPGGAGGTTILSGTATPTNADGATGNYYLETDANTLYGPKASAAYGSDQSGYTNQTPASTPFATNNYTHGREVTLAVAGRITALKFYRVDTAVNTHVLRLWNTSTQAQIASVTTSSEVGTGWITGTLSAPVLVTAGQVVRVTFENTPGSQQFARGTAPVTNGDVTIGSLAWNASTPATYPDSSSSAGGNEWMVDVVFQREASSWPVALRSDATIPRQTATITTASLANNAQETGTVTLAKGYRLLRIQTSVAARVRLYSTTAKRDADLARAVGTDPTGDHGVMFDFVTSATGGVYGSDQSVYTTQTPNAQFADSNTGVAENILFARPGRITALRYYRHPSAAAGETSRLMNLWNNAGTQVGTATTSGDSGSGWKSASLASPVSVIAGDTFRASTHSTGSTTFAYISGTAPPISNGDLQIVSHCTGVAVGRPNDGDCSSGAAWFVDVIFQVATSFAGLAADLSPVVDGFDGKTTPDGIIPYTVTNMSGASSVVTATLTWLSTE